MFGYLKLKQFWNFFGLNIYKKETKFALCVKTMFYFILLCASGFTQNDKYYEDIQDILLSFAMSFFVTCFAISSIILNYNCETLYNIVQEITEIENRANRFTKNNNKTEIVSLVILLSKIVLCILMILVELYLFPLNYLVQLMYYLTGNVNCVVDNILFYIVYKMLNILRSNNNELKIILSSTDMSEENRILILEEYMTQLNNLQILFQKTNNIFDSLMFFKALLDFTNIIFGFYGIIIYIQNFYFINLLDLVLWLTNYVIDVVILPLLFDQFLIEVSI